MLYAQPQLKLVRTPMVVQQPQVQPQVQQVQPQVQQQTAVPTAQASQIVGSGVQVRAFAAKGFHSCWQVLVTPQICKNLCFFLGSSPYSATKN